MQKLYCSIILTVLAFQASAETHCVGKLGNLSVKRSGTVLASGPGGLPSVYICSLDSPQNNISTETCKAIYSTLLSAKVSDKEVNMTFSPDITSCSEIASWQWATNLNWVFVKD